MPNLVLYAYVFLIVAYRASENIVMAKMGTMGNRPKRDWTAALIIVPYTLTLAGPLIEHLYFGQQPGAVFLVTGTLCFLEAMFFRIKAHLDLNRGFSMAIEKLDNAQLVQTGLYKHIRHPLYLGNLLLFIACPLFMAARYSWIFTGLGLVGLLVRIKIEEGFLQENLDGYTAYIEKTSALIPGLY